MNNIDDLIVTILREMELDVMDIGAMRLKTQDRFKQALKKLLLDEIEKVQTIATSTNGTSITIALSKQEVKQAISNLFSEDKQ